MANVDELFDCFDENVEESESARPLIIEEPSLVDKMYVMIEFKNCLQVM